MIELGAFAEAVVVIDHTGDAVLAANVDYVLGDGAKLTVVSVQDWDEKAVHVAQHNALVGRDASFKSVVVTFGGDVVRIHPRVAYAAPGGEAELFGLYFTDAGQHQEHRLLVDHNTPHCKSNVAYKGALQGQDAHAVWIGDVLIQAAAEGTDTYELNRNLVLTDGARVDSVPNLEIETGEIAGAGHASATGRFDDEQLFYLMARGIPGDRGPPPRRPRLLRRAGPADRSARRPGAPDRQDRGRAGGLRLMAFVRVCALSELEADTPKRVEVDGTPVSVVHTEGEVFAINDICSHANVSLSEGEVEDCAIECWLHGSSFDLRTGKPSGLPRRAPSPHTP